MNVCIFMKYYYPLAFLCQQGKTATVCRSFTLFPMIGLA